MKKGVLLICTCLLLVFGHAQETSSTEVTTQDSALTIVSDLTAIIKDNSRVSLNWRLSHATVQDFITIERSNNGKDFETVAVLKQTVNSIQQEWQDEAAPRGRNSYRIRFTDSNGEVSYSTVATTLLAGDITFKFYPNPVDNVLIVRTESVLDIQILDNAGRLRISQNKLQGLQTINVSSLEKGIYYLIAFNRTAGTSTQERLLKN